MSYNPIPTTASGTISSTAVSLASPPNGANRAVLNIFSNPIRFTVDGTTPTASLGLYATSNYEIVLKGYEIAKFQAIREGGSDATYTVAYFSGSPDPDD